jgi:hypothetical protein
MFDAAPIAAVLNENSTINEPGDMTGADEIDLCKFVRCAARTGAHYFQNPNPEFEAPTMIYYGSTDGNTIKPSGDMIVRESILNVVCFVWANSFGLRRSTAHKMGSCV